MRSARPTAGRRNADGWPTRWRSATTGCAGSASTSTSSTRRHRYVTSSSSDEPSGPTARPCSRARRAPAWRSRTPSSTPSTSARSRLGGVDLPGTGGPGVNTTWSTRRSSASTARAATTPAAPTQASDPPTRSTTRRPSSIATRSSIDLAASDLLEQGATLRVTGTTWSQRSSPRCTTRSRSRPLPGLLRALADGRPRPRRGGRRPGRHHARRRRVRDDHERQLRRSRDRSALGSRRARASSTRTRTEPRPSCSPGATGSAPSGTSRRTRSTRSRLLDGPAPEGGWPPMLIVAGELDPITPAADARRLAGAIERSDLPRGAPRAATTRCSPTRAPPCVASFLADPRARGQRAARPPPSRSRSADRWRTNTSPPPDFCAATLGLTSDPGITERCWARSMAWWMA